ncbi:MAG: hypothetical protein Kow0059_22140 [Candidatus Sumerlaeia bacterium]
MNCLPVMPDALDSPAKMDRYFSDLKRWNFDVPYNAFYAFPMERVTGEWKPIYIEFARRARQMGLPACVQIQSTVAWAPDVGWEQNAQFYADNTTDLYDHHHSGLKPPPNYFASFSSRTWRDFLKNLISLFFDYGYNWLVIEEPMQRADIPGTKDPFYQVFRERHPDLPYPLHAADSLPYYTVQRLKRQLLIEFLDELTTHARRTGFDMIGVMPWFFTPTHENTPVETWNTGCDQGRVAGLPNVDFLVVRMQPDNLFAEATIAEQGEALPRQVYVENMAHHFGKPIVAVNNPTNEHIRPGETETLIPYDFFAPYTLAAAAASPSGQTRHWYSKHYELDSRQMDLMAMVNTVLPRLGTPRSPWAVVFSWAGADRVWPRGWRQTWRHLYFLTSQFMFVEGAPMHTVFGESLRSQLEAMPWIKCLFLLPWFPLPPHERVWLRQWAEGAPERRLVFLGAHKGYTWEPGGVYYAPNVGNNEVVELFGLDPDVPLRTRPFSASVRLKAASSSDPSRRFWGDGITIEAAGYTTVPDRSDPQISVVYEDEDGDAVVVEKSFGPDGGRALFVGCALDGAGSDFPMSELLAWLAPAWDALPGVCLESAPLLVSNPGEVLWNVSSTGYLIAANLARHPNRVHVKLNTHQIQLWDVMKRRFGDSTGLFDLPPHSILCLRLVPEGTALLDVFGQLALHRASDDGSRIHLEGHFGTNVTVWTKQPLKRAVQNNRELSLERRPNDLYAEHSIGNVNPGRGAIVLEY